jgi:hypothetical protein
MGEQTAQTCANARLFTSQKLPLAPIISSQDDLSKQRRSKQDCMTIGIGVLCSTKPKPHTPRPDSFVLIADTMGSTETDSTDALHKMWLDDDLQLYAVGAGTMEYGGELFVTIGNELRAVVKRTHGEISGAMNKAFQMLRSQHFQWDVMWSKLQVPGVVQLATTEQVREEWEKFQLNIHMLMATFDHQGQAHLYLIGQFEGANKVVYLYEFPGYAAIGTGADNAHFWLNYRGQYLGRALKQSVYHAYEAKRMAAKAPTVNESIEIAIVLPGAKSFHLTDETPEIEGCPVSLPELESMFTKYGPRTTSLLGHPKITSENQNRRNRNRKAPTVIGATTKAVSKKSESDK